MKEAKLSNKTGKKSFHVLENKYHCTNEKNMRIGIK